jgi:hypothetical protein
MLNVHMGLGVSKKAAREAYAVALDAMDGWGRLMRPYARPGCRTITQYHKGWTTATAFYGWDHVNMLPMLFGFRDTVLPRRQKKRVVRGLEATLEVRRLLLVHGKDASSCYELKLAIIR